MAIEIKKILSKSAGLEEWIEIGGKIRYDGKVCKVIKIEADGENYKIFMVDAGFTTYDALGLVRPLFAPNTIPIPVDKIYEMVVTDVTAIQSEEVISSEDEEDKEVISSVTINGVEYSTLSEALENANDGDIVTINGTTVFEEKVTLDKKITVTLADDANLTIPTVENNYGMIVKGDVTIEGNGSATTGEFGIGVPAAGKLTINGGDYKTDGTYLIGSWGEVTINGGNFESPYCCANAFNNGKVYINGGNFVCPDGETMILGEDAKSVMVVSGGTFNHPVKEKYCAEGYIPKDNGDGTYTVELSE